jgi:WD40 repeat protein
MKKITVGMTLLGLTLFGLGVAQQAPKLEKPVWFTPSVGGVINSARFNGNDSLAMTTGSDGIIQIWNTSTGQITRSIYASSERLYLAVFSKDGAKILSSGADDTTRIWNTKTGELIKEMESGSGAANFSPDGNRFVTAANNNKDILVVNSKDAKTVLTLKGHTDYVYEAEFSPDGGRIVSSSDDTTAKVWDAKTGKLIRSFKHTEYVLDAAFMAGNSRIVTGDDGGFMRIWDVTTGKELKNQKIGESGIGVVVVSQDQTKFLTGSYDSTIRLWDAKTFKEIRAFKGHERAIYSLSFGLKDQKIISASSDGTAKIWDLKTGKQLFSYNKHTFNTNSVMFSADNKKILISTSLRDVRIMDTETGKELLKFRIGEVLAGAALSPDGVNFVTASDVHGDVWNATTGELVTSLNGHDGGMKSAIYSSDGLSILSVGEDKTVRLWNSTSGEEKWKLSHEKDILKAIFSTDQKQIISLDDVGTTFVWDALTGKEISKFATTTPDFYFLPNLIPVASNVVIVSNRVENGIAVWDLNNKALFAPRTDELTKSGTLRAVSADASMALIYLGNMTSAFIQELATGKTLLEIPKFDGRSKVQFSANNQQLAVASPDGLQLFQIPSELLAQVKKLDVPTMQIVTDANKPNLETRVGIILALSTKGALTGLQFLGLKRLIEDQKEPKELTDYLEQRLPEKDFLELVYAGFFERFNVPRGKP